MKSHDGAVTVYSEPGKGTTFHLYFPAAGAAAVQSQTQVQEAPRGRGQHVLHVDDEAALVLLLKRMLERSGYRATGATDPLAALQIFRSRPQDFDAVVTDLSMPGMSGLDLAGRLRQIRPDLPIVIMSGYIRQEDVEAAAHLGVTDVILKPNATRELGPALYRLLKVEG
jgi:CheY-like chemotaxis protein